MRKPGSALVVLVACLPCFAQQLLTPVAGTPFAFPQQSIPAAQAPLGLVGNVALDSQGNLYAADYWNNLVLKITPAGVLSIVTANGTPLKAGNMAFDGAGNLYINQSPGITVVDPSGKIVATVPGISMDTVDAQGRSYVTTGDSTNNGVNCVVLRYGPSGSTVVAGTGTCAAVGGDGMPATQVPLARPYGVALDAAGNIYFRDAVGVRKVDTSGILRTLTQGLIVGPLTVDPSGNIYGPGVFNDVLKLTPSGVLTTIAGGKTAGFSGDGGPATSALLNKATQVAVDAASNIYIADSKNYRVRRIRPGTVPTIDTVAGNGRFLSGGDGGAAASATLFGPFGMVSDAQGGVLFTEPLTNRIRRIDSQGVINTYLGGTAGFSGDGGLASRAALLNPQGLAMDPSGNLYIADTGNGRVRKVGLDGTITTVAGGGATVVGPGQTVPATDANIAPVLLAFDPQGNLYILGSGPLLKVSPQGMVSWSSINGGPFCNSACIGGGSSGLAFDKAGNLYLAHNAITARFGCIGDVTRYAPDGAATVLVNNVCPQGLLVDSAGNVVFSNGTVNRITQGGIVTTLASYNSVCSLVPLSNVCLGMNPGALAFDAAGNILVAEVGRISKVFTPTPSCPLTLAPAAVAVPASAGTGGLTVGGDASCAWQTQSTAAWLGVTSAPQGSGAGTVYFSFAENTGTAPRQGFIYVGGQTFTVLQAAATPPAATAFEPALQIHLSAGFYIAEATLASNARGGFWGMEVLTSLGQAAGGFNLGGGAYANGGFGAFLLTTPQTVTATLSGFTPTGAQVTLRLLDSKRNLVGTPVTGTFPLTLTQSLQPGFYITEVSNTGAVPANFLLSLSADFFSGGVDTGGYLGPGITGFGAFYVPEDQDVTIRLYGRNSYGPFGAESMILTLRDSNRTVLKVVSPP